MASVQTKLSQLDLCAKASSEGPSPLRIVKRRSNLEGLLGAGRRTSGRSDGSTTGPSDNANACLTITKRRLGRDHSQLISSEAARSRRSSKDSEAHFAPALTRDENVHPCQMFKVAQTLNIGKTRTSRPKLNATLGRLQAAMPIPHSTTPISASHGQSMDRECPISYPRYERRVEQPVDPVLELPLPARHDMDDHKGRAQFVLCPHISVLCDTAAVHDGLQRIWAAIEVSRRLSKLPLRENFGGSAEGVNIEPDIVTGSFVDNTLDRFFAFGCLYDLTVEVVPRPGITVRNMLQEQPFPTTIYAGSSILMVVELQFDTGSAPLGKLNGHQSHSRQRSDELIEDLELQLGTSQFPYMEIRVVYSHSAFPAQDCLEAVAGVASVHSRLTTTAVASLKRQNDRSPWSPRLASTPNILFPLIEGHWGIEKAQEAMRQMVAQRSTPRRPAKMVSIMSLDRKARSSCTATEYSIDNGIIPHRRSSLDYLERMDKLPIVRKRSPSMGKMKLSTRSTEYAPSEESDCPSRRRPSLGSDGIRVLLPRTIDAAADDRNGRLGRPGRVWGTTKLGSPRNGGRWAWASWF